jgi:hypothetical protein
MAEAFEVEVNGEVYEVQADTPQQAATFARLLAAREQGVSQAEAGAVERSNAKDVGLDDPMSPEFLALRDRAQQEGTAAAAGPALAILGTGAGIGASGGIVPFAIGAGKSALGSMAGAEIGRRAGGVVGQPEAGATVGGLVGGIGGPMVGKDTLLKYLGGRGALGEVLRRAVGGVDEAAAAAAPKAARGAASEATAALRAQRLQADIEAKQARAAAIAAREARAAEKHAVEMERLKAQADLLRARATGKAPPKSPKPVTQQPTAEPPAPSRTATAVEPEMLPDDAVAAVVDPIPEPTILPKGQRAMATNLGGPARPGPAPTAPEDLEETLRRSLEAIQAQKAAAAGTVPAPAASTTGKPFRGSMSLELERRDPSQFTQSEVEALTRAMPKGEGPGTAPWALGKRPRLSGDIPQTEELVGTAKSLASSPDAPPALRERKKLKLELARMLQDPRWRDAIGSDEVINTGVQLEEALLGKVVSAAVKRAREKAGGLTASWEGL